MGFDELVGKTLGQYEIRNLLGVGTRQTYYKAYQPTLKRDVTLRTLNQALAANPENVQAFTREAELLAKLEHPHIVPIYDYGVDKGYHYIITRLIKGSLLGDRIKQLGRLPFSETVTIIKQVASAMDYVHSESISTGEITRGRVTLDSLGNSYINSMFFATLKLGSDNALTRSYLAPERWQGEAATPASDQYSFGIFAYRIITGKKPFNGFEHELHEQHRKASPPPLQSLYADIPLAVNDVLNRAMAKKPEDRYPTVMDFAREFEKAMQAVPQHLFISYSRRDKDYAQQLFEHLGGNGFDVWIDSKIDYGDRWFNEIDDAIESCAAFLLIMTPSSYESEWVQKEILLAKRYKKPIFPLLLAGDEFGIVIDLQFADVKGAVMPDVDFHRRLRRTVFGDV